MSTVDTTYGTYLGNLVNPQVMADLVDTKLIDKIVFAPLARVDRTLEGRAGNTVTLPSFAYIGDATEVEEGHDIPIARLTESTKQVTIIKLGRGVTLTDEALLSGYGDPYGEAADQIVKAVASSVDNKLLAELNKNTDHVYIVNTNLTPMDIPLALAEFGEDVEGEKVIIVSPDFYAKLVGTPNDSNWIPASEIAAEVRIRGTVGMAFGCQVMVSNRVKNNNFHIVKPGALAIYMKRDTMIEPERHAGNQSTDLYASKLFAPYLMDSSKAIKIVSGVDPALKAITVTSAAGTGAGDTALTVTYTPGAGESYVYKVGDTVTGVALDEDLTGWTSWDGSADITAATGKVLTLASVKSSKAVAAGYCTVTAHA